MYDNQEDLEKNFMILLLKFN